MEEAEFLRSLLAVVYRDQQPRNNLFTIAALIEKRLATPTAERPAAPAQACRRGTCPPNQCTDASVYGLAPCALSDDALMDLARDECDDFRWPSTALSIMRKAIAAAGVDSGRGGQHG
jgi:hypothetical protein